MLIEQAIFTSAETARAEGYQLVATSPGITKADAQVLALWGPSHGALLREDVGAQSVQFHLLPSGAYGIARTRPMGAEYSGRRGPRLHTHYLVVPPELLARFANNPFALLQAAVASGELSAASETTGELTPLALVGRASAFQTPLVERVLSEIGLPQLVALLDSALSGRTLAVASRVPLEELFAALLNCLPVECRPEFSLATGLHYSPHRPFRWIASPGEAAERKRLEQQFGVTAFDCDRAASPGPPRDDGWAGFVARLVADRGIAALAAPWGLARSGLTSSDLPKLARELEHELDLDRRPVQAAASSWVHAHAAHARTQPAQTGAAVAPQRPAQTLKVESPAMVEQLETLDDAVYDAIAGKAGALEELTALWPVVIDTFDQNLVEESREQYLRYALQLWDQYLETAADPEPSLAALEVLCLLFDD